MSNTIGHAKRNAKRYTLREAALFLKTFSTDPAIAVYRFRDGYLCARENKAKFIYRHAIEGGATDPDFMGFYGGVNGWQYFLDDCQVAA